MKIYLKPGKSKNILATIAIGPKFLSNWEKFAKPSWLNYCKEHDLGMVVFDKAYSSNDDPFMKKANWQKLLIGKQIQSSSLEVSNICYLDIDIIISPLAPNIFENYDSKKFLLVSQINNLPNDRIYTLRRLAFLRHTHLDSRYELDSALFMSPEAIFRFHSLPEHKDYACTGLFVFNVANHTDLLYSWFIKYDSKIQTITGGGEEPHLNHEFQSTNLVEWLPYKFQALWIYEVAIYYPFLFKKLDDKCLIRECIESSLYLNYFLHFAGSWNECEMWKVGGFFEENTTKSNLDAFKSYMEMPVKGVPKGMIKPEK